MRTSAIVLAAGSGSRMGTEIKKQYMELGGKPLITYALQAFEDSFVDEIVLVTPEEDIAYCEKEIVARFGFKKVTAVIAGGAERCHSVALGLRALAGDRGTVLLSPAGPSTGSGTAKNERLPLEGKLSAKQTDEVSLVFIHDGARPFVTSEMLHALLDAARAHRAAVAAVPTKNTIKVADEDAFVLSTPDRSTLWEIQTPQVFDFNLIHECYEKFLEEEQAHDLRSLSLSKGPQATYPTPFIPTDDAQLVERYADVRVKLVETSYRNLKVTTPEDFIIAEALLNR